MSRWFRHYSGMMRDEKLVAVAIRAKQPVHLVVWVWGAILESAAEIDRDGLFEVDAAEIAYFLRADEADICAVLDGLANARRVAENRVVKWGDRQYQSDKSAERQARYRERRRTQNTGGDNNEAHGDVTIPSRDGSVTPQEADTDTETETDTEKTAQPSLAARPDAATLTRMVFEAAGIAGFRDERHPRLLDMSPIYGLIDANYDLRREILPVISERSRNATFTSWRFFEKAVIETAEKNRAIQRAPAAPTFDWRKALEVFREGTWADGWGPKPGERGCRVPAGLLAEFGYERAA